MGRILGIESSCDDSSIAVLDSSLELIHYAKISQEKMHEIHGGVVPELAARLHTKALPDLVDEIKFMLPSIDAIAVTNEPGLSVSLIGGVSMAKALSISLKIPLIAINHLVGHIYSLFLDNDIKLPLGVLLVSGGHTMILDIDESGKISVLAKTNDDSFGESFDKVAKMLGLGYPGGALIEEMAKSFDAKNGSNFSFTIPLKGDKSRLEYSFSGLKNQVRLAVESLGGNLTKGDIASISYAFQKAACSHILDKLNLVFKMRKFSHFGIVGGASANLTLRSGVNEICKKHKTNLLLAPLKYCSDNAYMVARAGVEKFKRGEFISYKELQIRPKYESLSL